MASIKWFKTQYPGVRYRLAKWPGNPGKQGKVYYGRMKGTSVKLGEEWKGCKPLKANKILTELKVGTLVQNKNYKGKTFAEGFELYSNKLDRNKDRLKKDCTGYRSELSIWNKHLKDRFGHLRVDSLTDNDKETLKTDLKETGLSAQTRKHIIGLLTKCAKYQKYTLEIETPKVDNAKTDKPDTVEFYQSFIEHLRGEDSVVADMMMFAIFSGFRRGEIINLKWLDVDLDRNLLYVSEQKNGSRDYIPLLPRARAILEQQPKTKSVFCFPGTNGGKRYANSLTKTARRICDRFGMPSEFRPFHALRHWFASLLASSGQVDQYMLQKLMRHKDPAMTQRYSHMMPEAFERVRQISHEVF